MSSDEGGGMCDQGVMYVEICSWTGATNSRYSEKMLYCYLGALDVRAVVQRMGGRGAAFVGKLYK